MPWLLDRVDPSVVGSSKLMAFPEPIFRILLSFMSSVPVLVDSGGKKIQTAFFKEVHFLQNQGFFLWFGLL
jgi:hypothetical protein